MKMYVKSINVSNLFIFVSMYFSNIFGFQGFLNAGELSGYIAGWESGGSTLCLAASYSKDCFLPGLEVIGIYCLIDNPSLTDDAFINISEENVELLKVSMLALLSISKAVSLLIRF